MTKEEILKQLRHKRDDICDPDCTSDRALQFVYKVQRDTYDKCIKLVEQL